MNERNGLTAQEARAIAALLRSRTLAEAAAAAGVSERTLRRWLAEREPFQRALRREQRAVMASVTSRLQESAVKALDTLEAIMEQGDAPAAARVSAARTVLELAHERIDMEELASRIEAMERAKEGLR